MQECRLYCDKKIKLSRVHRLRPIESDAYWGYTEDGLRPARLAPRLERGGASANDHGEGLESASAIMPATAGGNGDIPWAGRAAG